MFRTSNPAFTRNNAFAPAQTWADLEGQGRGSGFPTMDRPARPANPTVMTMQGTVNKSFFLLAVAVCTAMVGWNIARSPDPALSPMALWAIGGLGAFIVAMVCIFVPKSSPITAPLYAALKGVFLGAISAWYAMRFNHQAILGGAATINSGIVVNAMLLTFGILGGLLVGYSTKLVRPGPIFRNVVITGTIGVCLYGLIAMVASLFGSFSLASVYSPSNGGLLSIGFSLLLVALASGNLVLDFEFIDNGVKNQAPRYMEWYGAFGLLVSVVWLYLEVLRLLAKLRRE